MENEYFKIEIDILEANDIYKDLICLEVEVGDELADMARITLAIEKKSDGNWTYLDDPRFTLWKEIKIVAGFQGSMETLFIGYITRVKPNMARDIATSTLSIWAVQKCVAMDREEKLIAWKNMKDSDIAKSILSAYGFVPYVKDTEIVPEKDVASVIQRETDLQFLKRLAQNNGYHFYVENNDAYFEKPKLKGESSQPVLAYDFGQETSVKCLSIDANGLLPTAVSLSQVDVNSDKGLNSKAEDDDSPGLGKKDAQNYKAPNVPGAIIYPRHNITDSKAEMDILSKSISQRSGWFVTGEGMIAGNLYGHVLKAGKTVTIKGVNKTYSGEYYVSHVTHSFSSKGYFQAFKVKRDALMPTGMENFGVKKIW